MSSRFFYDDNDNSSSEHEEEKDDYFEFLPNSSSSVDRSSIGSIPWADDAIRQNQLEWERVERMLSGEEDLPEELELRNEILEWLRKFPPDRHKLSFDSGSRTIGVNSLDIDSISNLSLESNDNDGFATPTPNDIPTLYKVREIIVPSPHKNHAPHKIDLNLRVNSVPLALQQRQSASNNMSEFYNKRHSDASLSPPSVKAVRPRKKINKFVTNVQPVVGSTKLVNSANRSQIRMPLIHGLVENHESFVQLTRVPQPKSAAIGQLNSNYHEVRNSYRQTPWNASFFAKSTNRNSYYNRNAIILPSIQQKQVPERSSNSTSFYQSRASRNYLDSSASATTANSSTIRSISAAVRHPHLEAKTYFMPYSASKFKQDK